MSAQAEANKPYLVAAVGELLWDLFPEGEKLGGAPFNFISRVQSLGDRGVMVSRLGDDDRARRALEKASDLGLGLEYFQRDEHLPTGTVNITLKEDRSPNFHIVPNVAYDHLEMTSELEALAGRVDCVCFGTLVQRAPIARATVETFLGLARDAERVFDINLRKDCHSPDTIESSLRHATMFKMNDEEAIYLSGLLSLGQLGMVQIGRELIERYQLSVCLITLGDRGAIALKADELVYEPGHRVDVVDTCGAGDAFTAGFIHAYLRGKSLKDCSKLGCALGALVASKAGATDPVSLEQVNGLLAADGERIIDPRYS